MPHIISLLRYMRNIKKLLMLYVMRGGEGDMRKQFWKGYVIVLVPIFEFYNYIVYHGFTPQEHERNHKPLFCDCLNLF